MILICCGYCFGTRVNYLAKASFNLNVDSKLQSIIFLPQPLDSWNHKYMLSFQAIDLSFFLNFITYIFEVGIKALE